MPKIHDISQPVGPGIWVWPGDQPYERAWTWRLADGASCNVGQVTMSCHTGTHMDAPYHFAERGSVETIPLEACIGPAVVVSGMDAAPVRARSGSCCARVAPTSSSPSRSGWRAWTRRRCAPS